MERMSTITVLTEEVKKLMQEWMESYGKRDTAFLERYLSDDYVSTFPDGTVLDKKGEIESVKSGAVAFTEIPSEMKVRIYGEAAVITGRSTIKAKVKGQDVSGEYRFTHMWIKRSDRWEVVASQVTRIAKP
jgi:ketosteroid isomerase-like protein